MMIMSPIHVYRDVNEETFDPAISLSLLLLLNPIQAQILYYSDFSDLMAILLLFNFSFCTVANQIPIILSLLSKLATKREKLISLWFPFLFKWYDLYYLSFFF